MRFSIFILLIFALQIRGCDFTGGPARVQKQTEDQLRQYFPLGHAVVSPQQGAIAALTCTQGVGKAAVEEIVKYLETKPGIQRLEQARRLPIKFSPYRFFVLGFDEYYIRLDADTKQHWILAADSEYRARYSDVCAPSAIVN
jgi:hypothetical protein